METELQLHLEQGRDALIKAALDGSTRNVPLEQVKGAVKILVENGALAPEAGLGILAVDARIINQAGKKASA